MKNIFKFILSILLIAAVGWAGFAYGPGLAEKYGLDRLIGRPCSKPIAYSIGEVDARFGLDAGELSGIVRRAAEVWEKTAGKQLFSEIPSSGVRVSLIYDSRQESTDELKKLGINIKGDQESYESLKMEYETAEAGYEAKKAALDEGIAAFENKKTSYEKEVAEWNRKGGAPQHKFNQLQKEKDALNGETQRINADVAALNDRAKEVNALAHALNKLARELNLKVEDYNSIGEERSGKEFQEEYVKDETGEYINIYQFSDQDMLLRVLTHELGHALGLEHTENPEDIMYRLNEGREADLTQNDVNALRQLCGI